MKLVRDSGSVISQYLFLSLALTARNTRLR